MGRGSPPVARRRLPAVASHSAVPTFPGSTITPSPNTARLSGENKTSVPDCAAGRSPGPCSSASSSGSKPVVVSNTRTPVPVWTAYREASGEKLTARQGVSAFGRGAVRPWGRPSAAPRRTTPSGVRVVRSSRPAGVRVNRAASAGATQSVRSVAASFTAADPPANTT